MEIIVKGRDPQTPGTKPSREIQRQVDDDRTSLHWWVMFWVRLVLLLGER